VVSVGHLGILERGAAPRIRGAAFRAPSPRQSDPHVEEAGRRTIAAHSLLVGITSPPFSSTVVGLVQDFRLRILVGYFLASSAGDSVFYAKC
jgi:hypothetical protein